MAAIELLVFLLQRVGWLPVCPSFALFFHLSGGTGVIHRAGNRNRKQEVTATLPDQTPGGHEAKTSLFFSATPATPAYPTPQLNHVEV